MVAPLVWRRRGCRRRRRLPKRCRALKQAYVVLAIAKKDSCVLVPVYIIKGELWIVIRVDVKFTADRAVVVAQFDTGPVR